MCDNGRSCPGQRLCYFRKFSTWHLFIQPGGYFGRPKPASGHCHNLCALRDDGCYGWKSSGHRLFGNAYDRFHDWGLWPTYSVAGNRISDTGVSSDTGRILFVSGNMDRNISCACRLLYVGKKAGRETNPAGSSIIGRG